ncbi:MAG: DUF4129 domain-containing protein [Syntrophomonadaceae bacterium]|nr:DUF4129 domain-containing protein [Syntrophomonadaceae bacterium]
MTLCNRRIYLKEAIARFEISIGFFIVTAIIAGALQVELREYFLTIIVGFLSNFLAMTLCKQTEPISSRYLLAGTLGITVFIGSLLALLNWGQTFLINISTWIYTNTLPFISGIFLGILKWLLTKGKYIKNDSPPNAAPSSNEGVVSGWELPLHDTQWLKYILWFLMGLIILFLVVILIILFIYLIKYLLKPKPNKYSKEEGLETEPSLFSLLVVKVKKLFIKLNLLFVVYLSKDISLERLYSYLLLWGEGKEMPRLQHETPYEYSQRLSLKYPQQNEYIRFITESYVAYQYGNIRQSRETRNTLNAYLKKLYFARK